jgi:peptidoglycan hydrolase-like protein with peptidoglycan-binding domain
MKKIDKSIWWSLPILLGAYLIYRQFKKANAPLNVEKTNNKSVEITNEDTTQTYKSTYPLKYGSRDTGSPKSPKGLVVEIQKLINAYGGYKPKIGAYVSLPLKLTEDGIYGKNTEWAVEQYIGKKTIDSRADTLNLEQKIIENQQKNNSIF